MTKNEVEEATRRALEKGGVLAKLYFDMQSENESDLQPLMTDLISNRLLKTPGVLYCVGEIEQPLKLENTYSTSAVVTILLKDIGALINVAFNYAPAGVEILKPEKEVSIKTGELQSILIDVSNIAMQYSQYILSRVLTKEDYEKVQNNLKNRELVGKRLMDKKEGE